ncbi:MAG: LuxR C-terminal-related transcriptional regulator [Tannerella sp.]|jgi:DNA-binding NarL/FixJ family response regulator|nr:LuxR C-terminal-related transcriptional regulator [Tannerella sp.]
MINKKKVLIVEPSGIIVDGLVKIIGDSAHLETLSPLSDIDNLNSRLASAMPNILLLNPTLLPYSKRPVLNALMQEYPLMAIVALVYQYVESLTLRLFHGVVDIREERERICEILEESSASVLESVSSDDNSYELSPRETDVLILIAKGLMNKEIAERLNISIHTVISHRKNITRKTNIKSAAGLAMYALMNNLIEEGAI